ncbi:MAG: hypothetical protein LBV74_18070 [Tannerella sp.]|jgi:hypothetical protein|nr:hypothetical protein [Tannerella sp.]
MKAILILFNQAYYNDIIDLMDQMLLRGFTYWKNVITNINHIGKFNYGDSVGSGRIGVIYTVVEKRKVDRFVDRLCQIDNRPEQFSLQTYVLDIEKMI